MKWNRNKALRTFLKFQAPNNRSTQSWSHVRVRRWSIADVPAGKPECRFLVPKRTSNAPQRQAYPSDEGSGRCCAGAGEGPGTGGADPRLRDCRAIELSSPTQGRYEVSGESSPEDTGSRRLSQSTAYPRTADSADPISTPARTPA